MKTLFTCFAMQVGNTMHPSTYRVSDSNGDIGEYDQHIQVYRPKGLQQVILYLGSS